MLSQLPNVLRVAVVGSGPSGYYTSYYLHKQLNERLKNKQNDTTFQNIKSFEIDMLERSGVGTGLVRNGVAPDHPEVKNVSNQITNFFEKYAKVDDKDEENFGVVNYYGGVEVGRTESTSIHYDEKNEITKVPLSVLPHCYHAVFFCIGAEGERTLNITEGIKGVYSGGSFVRYYNGGIYPDDLIEENGFSDDSTFEKLLGDEDLCKDLNSERYKSTPWKLPSLSSAVIGHGNVGLDIARIILKGNNEEMRRTDETMQTLQKLKSSNINTIHIIGRRGAVQNAWTTKEIRELFDLQNSRVYICKNDLIDLNEESRSELTESRAKSRLLQVVESKGTLLPLPVFIRLATSSYWEHIDPNDFTNELIERINKLQFNALVGGREDLEIKEICDEIDRLVQQHRENDYYWINHEFNEDNNLIFDRSPSPPSPQTKNNSSDNNQLFLKKRKKNVFVHFLASPTKFNAHSIGVHKYLRGITLERNQLVGNAHQQKAKGTGVFYSLNNVSSAYLSLGYYPLPLKISPPSPSLPPLSFNHAILNPLPIDNDKHTTSSSKEVLGCVETGTDGIPGVGGVPGWYASGWWMMDSGSEGKGIIGNNIQKSISAISSFFSDLPSILPGRQLMFSSFLQLVEHCKSQEPSSNVTTREILTFDDWMSVVNEEKSHGEALQKASEKFTSMTQIKSFLKSK